MKKKKNGNHYSYINDIIYIITHIIKIIDNTDTNPRVKYFEGEKILKKKKKW